MDLITETPTLKTSDEVGWGGGRGLCISNVSTGWEGIILDREGGYAFYDFSEEGLFCYPQRDK